MKKVILVVTIIILILVSSSIFIKNKYKNLLNISNDQSITLNNYQLYTSNALKFYDKDTPISFHITLKQTINTATDFIGNDASISNLTLINQDLKENYALESLDYFITKTLDDQGEYVVTFDFSEYVSNKMKINGNYELISSFDFFELNHDLENETLVKKTDLISIKDNLRFQILSFWDFQSWIFL